MALLSAKHKVESASCGDHPVSATTTATHQSRSPNLLNDLSAIDVKDDSESAAAQRDPADRLAQYFDLHQSRYHLVAGNDSGAQKAVPSPNDFRSADEERRFVDTVRLANPRMFRRYMRRKYSVTVDDEDQLDDQCDELLYAAVIVSYLYKKHDDLKA